MATVAPLVVNDTTGNPKPISSTDKLGPFTGGTASGEGMVWDQFGANSTQMPPSGSPTFAGLSLTTPLATQYGGLGADNSAASGIPVFALGVVTVTTPTGTGAPVRATNPQFTANIGIGAAPSAAQAVNVLYDAPIASGGQGLLFVSRFAPTSNTPNAIYGFFGSARNTGNVNLTAGSGGVVGGLGIAQNTSGTSNVITCAAGLKGIVQNINSGTISKAAAVLAGSPVNSGGGAITTPIAFYAQTQGGWGIYQEDAGDNNYLNGNLLIGTTLVPTGATKNIVLGGGATSPVPGAAQADTVSKVAADTAAGDRNEYSINEQGEIERITGCRVRAAADFTKTSSVTLANVTGLTRNVEAGRKYAFRAVLFTTSNTSGGVQVAIAGTCTATHIIYEADVKDGSTLATAGTTRASALATKVGDVTAVAAARITIEGEVVVNAAGTLTVQFAQNASNGSASTVLTGSYFEIMSLG